MKSIDFPTVCVTEKKKKTFQWAIMRLFNLNVSL